MTNVKKKNPQKYAEITFDLILGLISENNDGPQLM